MTSGMNTNESYERKMTTLLINRRKHLLAFQEYVSSELA